MFLFPPKTERNLVVGIVELLALWVGERKTLAVGSREFAFWALFGRWLCFFSERSLKHMTCYWNVSGNIPCFEVPRTTSCNLKMAFMTLETMESPWAPVLCLPTHVPFLQDPWKRACHCLPEVHLSIQLSQFTASIPLARRLWQEKRMCPS